MAGHNRLTARSVATLARQPGRHADGGNLYLLTQERRLTASWIVHYRIGGKRRVTGAGSYPKVGLADARRARDQIEAQVRGGTDPLAAKDKQHKQAPECNTFGRCALDFIAAHESG